MTAKMTAAEAMAVHMRSGGRCEIAATTTCNGHGQQLHHRTPRGMGGSSDPDVHHVTNLLSVCEPCHTYLESHRAESYGKGWLVRHSTVPSNVAVTLGDGRRVLLDDDGGYQDPAPTLGDRADHEVGLADHETALRYDETARG